MQAKPVIHTLGSNFLAVGGTSAELKSDMLPNKLYLFTCTTACWVKQGPTTAVTASAAAGSVLCLPVQSYYFSGSNGNALAIIQDAAGGKASICQMDEV